MFINGILILFSLNLLGAFVAKQHSIGHQAMEQAVTADDLYHGLRVVQPSAMKELAIEKPNVSYCTTCDWYPGQYLIS